jgi:hypothetical protein
MACVCNRKKSAGLTSTYFVVTSTENGIGPIDTTSEKDDVTREESSFLQEIDEMNHFEETMLDGDEEVDYEHENNI